MNILTVEKLTKSFGGLTAVSSVDLHLAQGELVGLIGPNGAGKTTLFNLFTGVYKPTSGTIVLHNKDKDIALGRKEPSAICRCGLARTFQNIRLFGNMTVLDNVRVAMQQNLPYPLITSLTHLPPFGSKEREITRRCEELLEIVHLDHKKDELAMNLPYGEQRHLEIARAMATDPVLLLLDEPAAGMNPAETAQLTELISWLRNTYHLTILLIEHDMSLVMKLCERIYVLDYGKLIACGTPDEIKHNQQVIEAYLGKEVADA